MKNTNEQTNDRYTESINYVKFMKYELSSFPCLLINSLILLRLLHAKVK